MGKYPVELVTGDAGVDLRMLATKRLERPPGFLQPPDHDERRGETALEARLVYGRAKSRVLCAFP